MNHLFNMFRINFDFGCKDGSYVNISNKYRIHGRLVNKYISGVRVTRSLVLCVMCFFL